ncbi:adrenocortical dysplasia protein homolog [Pelodytes ibericus]
MARDGSCIGHPWILDVIAKYDTGSVKNKPVPAQVVEFVKMQESSSDDSECPAAVVYISDRKYYIQAIITKEAQDKLERENDHFTLASVKNKIIILKNFTVCFTELEDLKSCEFYLTVHHFTIMPMETNNVDIMNCNKDPEVQKKIKELWQNYMTELAMKESSSDVSLTQLLNIASEENFSALKSLAEQCLDLDGPANQEIPPALTKWGAESREDKNDTNRFTVSMNLLLIPPHEEAALDQMTEYRNSMDVSSDLDDPVDNVHIDDQSSLYSTAFSNQQEEPIYDITETQSANPWNKLKSLSVSVSSGSASQAKETSFLIQQSSEEELVVDADSSTPDLSLPHLNGSPENPDEISPLIFSDISAKQELAGEPEDITVSQVEVPFNSNTSLTCEQKNLDARNNPISPVLLHSSPESRLSILSNVKLSPIFSVSSEYKVSPQNVRRLVFPTEGREDECESRRLLYNVRARKAIKRKRTSDDSDATSSDLENVDNEAEAVLRPALRPQPKGEQDSVRIQSGENEVVVLDTDEENESMSILQLGPRDKTATDANLEKEKQQGCVRKINMGNSKVCGNSPVTRKSQLCHSSLDSTSVHLLKKDVGNKEVTTDISAISRTILTVESSIRAPTRTIAYKKNGTAPVIELNTNKMRHYDGTLFQYKYKPPSEDLCARVNSIRLPTDICEWAVKVLSETQEEVP